MIGRLQRGAVFGVLALIVGWSFLWRHESSPWFWIGLATLIGAHPFVLALEFLLSAWVVRELPSSPAGPCRWVRAWMAEIRCSLFVFAWRQPFRERTVPDHLPVGRKRGVVLIHGFLCNRGFWNDWMRELTAEDCAFVAVNLEPVFASIDAHREVIDAAVRRVRSATGLAPVLVCHSMGGLAARAWLRGADTHAVHRVVTIGTPHRGTWLARFGHGTNGRQMQPGCEWLLQLERDDQASAAAPPFTCWYSDCDNIVFPPSTATMPGADNRLIRGLGHVQLALDRQLRSSTFDLLRN